VRWRPGGSTTNGVNGTTADLGVANPGATNGAVAGDATGRPLPGTDDPVDAGKPRRRFLWFGRRREDPAQSRSV
jgi:hypothetical protein